MTVINTNTASINAQYNLSKVNKEMETSMAALSSGKRINSAADDAAGLSIATRMESQIRGLNQAISNAADGQNLTATAEGAMDEITNMLQRMRELALQSSNDTMNAQDRSNLNNEMDQLKTEIDRIVDTTTFNEKSLLDGSLDATFQIGSQSGESLNVKVSNLSTSALGTTSTSLVDNASLSVTAQGTQAIENVVNLTFNGNDTYAFNIKFDNDAAKTLTLTGLTMASNDASDIADAINTAITADADTKGLATATATGSTVALTALDGTSINIASFSSAAAGTMTFNPITNSSADSVVLEDVTEDDAITNTGGTEATPSTASLQLEVGAAYEFKINGTTIEVATGDDTTAEAGVIGAAIKAAIEATSDGTATVTAAAQGTSPVTHLTFDISDSSGARIDMTAFSKLTTTEVPAGAITFENVKQSSTSGHTVTLAHGKNTTHDGTATGELLLVEDGTTSRFNFSNSDLTYALEVGGTTYTVAGKTADFQDELTRVAQAITSANTDVTAANVNGVLEISNASGSDLALAAAKTTLVSAPGVDAVEEGDAYWLADALPDTDISDNVGVQTLEDGSTAQTSDGVEAVASQMFLDFNANDRYTFTVDGDGAGAGAVTAEIVADVIGGDLSGVINAINAKSSTTSITAEEQNGQVVLSKADGTTFSLTGFSSEGTGSITAVNAGNQGGSTVLENDGAGATATAAASQVAVATTMELSFSAADKFSFKISDGSATATVRAEDVIDTAGTAGVVDDADDTADILAEIQRALTAANMDHVTAAASGDDDGLIILTNALGSKLEIQNFSSDGTGTLTATPGSTQGVGTILDDAALTSSYDSIAGIDALTSSAAQIAINTIDRALENVNDQRSNLGAISNRLDHTISNLGNIVVNTEASQSRIEDADFAATTGELTKAQIMSQAATAMLAQANASKQGVLSLLQG